MISHSNEHKIILRQLGTKLLLLPYFILQVTTVLHQVLDLANFLCNQTVSEILHVINTSIVQCNIVITISTKTQLVRYNLQR